MNQSSQAAPVATTISIAEVLRGIGRRKGLVGLTTLAAFTVALLFVLTADRRFTTEAQVLIENLATPYEELQNARQTERPQVDESMVRSQVSVIESRDIADRVVAALKLTDRAEFDSLKKGVGTLKQIFITLGFSTDPRSVSAEQRAALKYLDQLAVYVLPSSNVIGIKYTSNDPQTAAEVANALAETYVMSTREAQLVPNGRARDWLGEQIEDLRKKVVESEIAAEEFRAKAGLLKGASNTLGSQELSELNTQITAAEAASSEAKARADSIRNLLNSNGSVDTSFDVLGSPLIQRLREQQLASQRTLDDLSVTYLSSHPKVVSARQQLANVNKLIRSEALKIVSSLEQQAKVAVAREKSLRDSLATLKGTATSANIDDVRLRSLEREATANRTLLESLLSRYSDATARQDLASQPGIARIIQRASVPVSASFPKVGPIVALATFAGLALSLGLAFLAEIMAAADRMPSQNKIEMPAEQAAAPLRQPAAAVQDDPDMLARNLAAATAVRPQAAAPSVRISMPVMPKFSAPVAAPKPDAVPSLCEVPGVGDFRAAWHQAASVLSQTPSAYAHAIRQLASWAASVRQTLGTKRFATASTEFSALDLCVMSVALGRQAAAQGARVMIVDASDAPAAFESMLGVASGPGLAELLVGQAEFADALCKDSASSVQFLRAGINRQSAAGFVTSERMRMILDALEGVYDLTIVHCGQLTGRSPQVAALCPAAVIMSASPGMVDAARALQDLRGLGVASVQCVRVNQAMQQRPAA